MRPSEALAKHRETVLAILQGYAVVNPKVFGSTARGADTENSDLDLIVERGGLKSYAQLFEIEDTLSNLLGVRVDLHTTAEFGARSHAQMARDLKSL